MCFFVSHYHFTALHQHRHRIRSLFFDVADTHTHAFHCLLPHWNTVMACGLKTVLHSDAHFEELNQEWVLFAVVHPHGLACLF
jgi:hypothetical protein